MDTPADSDLTARKQAFPNNLVALLCGIWFLLSGWMWMFLMNLVISYPFAILGFILWNSARKTAPKSILNRVAGGFLIAGLVASLGVLAFTK